jgi:hypothetical protein
MIYHFLRSAMDMFIGNFQSTYEHPSAVETLKIIRQKHDESL